MTGQTSQVKSIFVLFGFLAVCFGAAAFGSIFTNPQSDWYANLAKPSFQPPSWIFGPVWAVLYFLMAMAGWIVWGKAGGFKKVPGAMIAFAVQLCLNAVWSPFFFGMHNIAVAMVILFLLWAAILVTMLLFWRIDFRGCWLMVPYLAWVSFATILNYYIYILNQ